MKKIVQIKNCLLVTQSRQKSYADVRRKPLEFEVGDMFMLKVLPWKGVIHFGKHRKLSPRYVGPFKVIDRIGHVAYKMELPDEVCRIHNTFNISNLKKFLANENLIIPLEEIQLDDKLLDKTRSEVWSSHGNEKISSRAIVVSGIVLGFVGIVLLLLELVLLVDFVRSVARFS
nr:putative reverse transcriptase domain-containing protein [Tanacetum cinerariifolium]GFA31528.1 putative reverse transcriptase domain-containing protein [Tanacetum cinerariifolium]